MKHKCIMQVDWNLEHATTSAILKIEERCFVLKLLLLYLLITLRHCLLLETQHDFTNLKVVWSNIDAESIIIKIIVIEDKSIETFSPLREDILLWTSLSILITRNHERHDITFMDNSEWRAGSISYIVVTKRKTYKLFFGFVQTKIFTFDCYFMSISIDVSKHNRQTRYWCEISLEM